MQRRMREQVHATYGGSIRYHNEVFYSNKLLKYFVLTRALISPCHELWKQWTFFSPKDKALLRRKGEREKHVWMMTVHRRSDNWLPSEMHPWTLKHASRLFQPTGKCRASWLLKDIRRWRIYGPREVVFQFLFRRSHQRWQSLLYLTCQQLQLASTS